VSAYLLALMAFVLFLSTQVGVPVLPALSAELGAGATPMAAILSAALMTIVLLQLFTGVLADRWGKRRMLLIGAALGGISSLLCALATRWQSLLLWRVAGGVADAFAMPALLGLTAELAARRSAGAFFGLLRSSQGLSYVVAPVIGGWLGSHGLRLPFLVDGALSLLALVILAIAFRPEQVVAQPEKANWVVLPALLRDRRVYAFLLFGLADNLSFPVLAAFLPTKAQGLGLTPWQISVILLCDAIGFTVACAVVGPLSDRWGRRPFVLLAQPGIVLAAIGLAWGQTLAPLAGFFALFGAAGATTFLMSTTMMADITPPEHAASRLGAFDALMDLGILVAPTVALSLHALTGRTDWLLRATALPAIVALCAALRMRDTRARPVPTTVAGG